MSQPDTNQVVRGFLATQSTLALGTINANGQPEVAPLFFVNDDRLNLYWLSSPESRHSTNLTAQPKVAATIYPSVWGWSDIVGLQIEGSARAISDERIREQILNLYLRKFTIPPELDSAISSSTLYMLTPTWIRWLDNSVSFRYKDEFTL